MGAHFVNSIKFQISYQSLYKSMKEKELCIFDRGTFGSVDENANQYTTASCFPNWQNEARQKKYLVYLAAVQRSSSACPLKSSTSLDSLILLWWTNSACAFAVHPSSTILSFSFGLVNKLCVCCDTQFA